ncbi:hypothetical protein F4778DRAFT_468651 [Xylariomycetidae sp. FL2044]|nr:hypothetical protein F4778DRAFT_468651 [Xylariomycetidae sp. FL2044]
MSHYPVFLIEYLGAPRNHHAIFVQNKGKSGTLFHVKGDIMKGMEYETRVTSQNPELSNTFISKSPLGWVKAQDVSRVDTVCRANPPPAKQFNGLKRINKNVPLRRCQEWTKETTESLKAEGILLATAS